MYIDKLRKLELEIQLLEKEVAAKSKRVTWWDKLKMYSGWIAALLTFAVSVWGDLYEPISTYLEKRKEKTEFDLNQGMISLVIGKGDNPKAKREAITLLSYYEYNSIPILMYFLETDKNDTTKRATVGAIEKILARSKRKKEITEELVASFRLFMSKTTRDDSNTFKRLLELFTKIDKHMERRQQEEIDTLLINKRKSVFNQDTSKYKSFLIETRKYLERPRL